MKARTIALSFFIILNCSITAYAQDGTKKVDANNIDYDLLSSLFLKKLNQLRTQKGLNNLGKDTTLTKAAFDQAGYMKKTGKVGHGQTIKNKESPVARVMYYKGTNDRVGENCIQIYLRIPTKDRNNTDTAYTYQQAADSLFAGWKNSKPHYHNMITPYYDVQGIGFSYDEKTGKFYSSEVFGVAAYIPPKHFKVVGDAWGVLPGVNNNDDFFSRTLANFLKFEGDSVFLYYSLLDYFNRYVKDANDGIALDIVAHEQFNCNHNNNLDGSPVFDGWMLQPVYYKALMKGNRYNKESNELYTYVGTIPSELKGSDIEVNTILIKGKHNAGYSYPITLEEGNLAMLSLDTYWDTTQGKLNISDTFNVSINHYIEFKRNVSKPTSAQIKQLLLRVGQYSRYINKIEIHTFSSIEGSTEGNLKLQKERADNIRTALLGHTNKSIEWNVEEKENWDVFYKQIEGTQYEYLKNLSKEDIKKKLQDPILLDSLDAFLAQQRTAIIRFSLKGEYNSNGKDNVSRIALQDAIQHGDSVKAWHIQSEMINEYKKGKMKIEDVVDNDVPIEKKFLPLLANMLAAKAVDIKNMHDPRFKLFVKRVFAIGKNYNPLKLSLCVSAINYLGENNDTIIDNKVVEMYLDQCAADTMLRKSIWRYYLDYYVAASYYNWYRHKYAKMDSCLYGVKKYYPDAVLTDEDYIKLGKLFNGYFRTSWTYDMIYPLIKKGTTDEDLLFLFITTAPLYMVTTLPQDEYIKYLKQARSMNPEKFCHWIHGDNWQLLREDFIKNLYCEQCGGKQ